MNDDKKRPSERTCKIDDVTISQYREALPAKADKIIEGCNDNECCTHVDHKPIPSKASVIEIIEKVREILFPGYLARTNSIR